MNQGSAGARLEAARRAAELCGVLANENRLLILCRLAEGAVNVSGLHESVCGISQPALSQHLALLRARGIVAAEKCGQSMVYRIVDDNARRLMEVLCAAYDCGRRE